MAGRNATSLFVALTLATATGAKADNVSVDAAITAGYESNAPRAEGASDVARDFTQTMRLAATRSRMLDERSGFVLGGSIAYENRQRFSALDNLSAKLDATYRFQPRPGYSAPWYELAGSLEALKYRDSELRDGAIGSVAAAVGRNVTDRIELKAGLGVEKRWAPYEHVYDLDWRKAFVEGAYSFRKNRIHARITRIWGDQVFSARSMRVEAKAEDDDAAFGPGYEAYRLQAVSTVLDAGLMVPLAERDSVAVGFSRFFANADGGHTYGDTLVRFSWLHRFQ